MLREFVSTAKSIIRLRTFRATMASSLVNDACLAFSAILMVMWNIPEVTILWAFSIYFLGSSLMLRMSSKINTAYLFLLLMVSMAACAFFARESAQLLIPAMLMILLTVIDLLKISLMGVLKEMASDTQRDYVSVVSTNNIMFLFMTGISLPLFGLIGSLGAKIFFSCMFILVALSYWQSRGQGMLSPGSTNGRMVKLSKEAKLLSGLSFSMNVVSFLSRRFILPLIVIKISADFDMADDALPIFGSVLGFVALFTMAFRGSLKPGATYRLMFTHYYIVLGGWFLMSMMLIFGKSDVYTVLGMMLLMLVIDYSTKIWAVGFMGQTGEVADKDNQVFYEANRLRSYFSSQIFLRSIGAGLGFAMAALLYSVLEIQSILMVFSGTALLSGLTINLLLNKNRSRESSELTYCSSGSAPK